MNSETATIAVRFYKDNPEQEVGLTLYTSIKISAGGWLIGGPRNSLRVLEIDHAAPIGVCLHLPTPQHGVWTVHKAQSTRIMRPEGSKDNNSFTLL